MPAMELRLENFIDAVQVISSIDDLNDETPIVVRQQDPATREIVTIVCSTVEPTRMVLPMNVVWIVFDRDSKYYKQALKRTSKSSDPKTPEFEQSWRLLYFYEEVFESQFYDPDDLNSGGAEPIGPATTTEYGIIRLSTPAEIEAEPYVVSEGHYSLTNNRDPRPHLEQHPEKPATILAIGSNIIQIIDQPAPELGMALVLDGAGQAQWRKLLEEDIVTGG